MTVYKSIIKELSVFHAQLVCVSKTRSNDEILDIYEQGQRIFGENRVQELVTKFETLPKDIKWHMIGHLQSNKVKYIASFVDLIHSVDNPRLLQEINKQALKHNRKINILLQYKIAQETTKSGSSDIVIDDMCKIIISNEVPNINVIGLMGMASFVDNPSQIQSEFQKLNTKFNALKTNFFADKIDFKLKSMGMSGDYMLALENGSNMVRIGSKLFN